MHLFLEHLFTYTVQYFLSKTFKQMRKRILQKEKPGLGRIWLGRLSLLLTMAIAATGCNFLDELTEEIKDKDKNKKDHILNLKREGNFQY